MPCRMRRIERIGWKQARPRPAEKSAKEKWFIGLVDELADESAKLIDKELRYKGIFGEEKRDAVFRIMIGVVSRWAEWCLCLECGIEGPIDQELIADYLLKKFRIDIATIGIESKNKTLKY